MRVSVLQSCHARRSPRRSWNGSMRTRGGMLRRCSGGTLVVVGEKKTEHRTDTRKRTDSGQPLSIPRRDPSAWPVLAPCGVRWFPYLSPPPCNQRLAPDSVPMRASGGPIGGRHGAPAVADGQPGGPAWGELPVARSSRPPRIFVPNPQPPRQPPAFHLRNTSRTAQEALSAPRRGRVVRW